MINKRRQRGHGRLAAARIASLEALPGWTWDTQDADWDEGFSYLSRFAERECHARVPSGYREDGFRLGGWTSKQRDARRLGRISAERIARLEALPGWTWEPQEADWEEGFSNLGRFVEREESARVPSEHVEDGFRLGTWTSKQRSAHRKHRISAARIARLEALPGWTWDARRLGRISAERIARLEALPGWTWDARDAAWEEGFSYLRRFVERESHARVPQTHIEDGYPVGKWTSHQRRFYRVGVLSGERIVRLEAVPGWTWEPHAADWEEGFSSLERFVEREGHARVPKEHVEDGHRLGGWAGKQRQDYRRGRLTADRIARLEALPGWTWDARKKSRPAGDTSTN